MSSSTSSITTTTINGTTRVTGLVSGINVDTIVEQLMTAERAKKLGKLQQKLQLATWRQEAYRELISDIRTFASKYFDTTSASSLLSQKNYLQYQVNSDSSAVTATYTTAASAGTHTIIVSQLATAATLQSSGSISKEAQASTAADYSNLSGKSFVLSLDGTARTVSLSNVTDLASLQAAIDDAVGSGKVRLAHG